MNYDHIETFLTVVVTGNITAAAKKLFISQSTVSTRIQQLEQELGTPLLLRQRGQHSITLTNYGTSFIPIAGQWAALWKDTQNLKKMADISILMIASVDAINNYTFVPLFQRHLDSIPNIRLSINTHHSNEIYTLVENRSADIGFVFSQISYPDIISIPIYRELMYLICHKDSSYHDMISCEDLDSSKEIFLNWGADYKQWHDRHWSPDVSPLMQVNTGSMLQRYLNKPGRWGIAPMSVINGAIRSNPELTYYTLKEPPSPRICYEIKNRYTKVSHQTAIETFETEIKEFIKADENICSFQTWMLNSDS